MPRGVKGSGPVKPQKSIDEKLTETDIELEKLEEDYKNTLASLKAKKKELLAAKKQEEKDELARVIAESGMSLDELRVLIEENKK